MGLGPILLLGIGLGKGLRLGCTCVQFAFLHNDPHKCRCGGGDRQYRGENRQFKSISKIIMPRMSTVQLGLMLGVRRFRAKVRAKVRAKARAKG
jgi:hypothetical protein